MTIEEAERQMADGEYVGTCRPQAFMNVVVAYPREVVLETFRLCGVQQSGPNATSDGYGLYTEDADGRLFVATKRES